MRRTEVPTFSSRIQGAGANADHALRLNIKPTGPTRPLAPRIRNTVRQLYPIQPIQRPHALQPIHVVHACVMRTVQYIHAHALDGAVARETTRRRRIGEEVEQAEGSARAVELVAGVTGEIAAERLVVVENRRVEERENRVR